MFKEQLPSKGKICSSLPGWKKKKKNSDKEYEHVLMVWN